MAVYIVVGWGGKIRIYVCIECRCRVYVWEKCVCVCAYVWVYVRWGLCGEGTCKYSL